MKKFLILVTVAVVAISLAAGCVGEVKTYIDSGQTIDIGVNQEFIIAIGANPTTGYDWEVSLDETILELVGKTYKLAEEAEHKVVGAGGVDYFRFRTLEAGEAEITMVYKRSWEDPTSQDETKIFTVNIDLHFILYQFRLPEREDTSSSPLRRQNHRAYHRWLLPDDRGR